MDPHLLKRQSEEPRRHLLARSDDGVVFARVVHRRRRPGPGDQLVGGPGHGRNHHGNLVAGVDLALDVAGDDADALDVGDRRAAELHDQTCHFPVRTTPIAPRKARLHSDLGIVPQWTDGSQAVHEHCGSAN